MTKRRAIHACVLASLFTAAVSTGALAQSGANLLQSKGYVADHNWFSPFDWEHFDAVSGNIMLTFTDLTLPGNAGRQLRFTRIFNSNGVSPFDTSRWTFGLAGIVMKVVEKNEDPPNNFDFNDYDIRTITSYTPLFIMADGALHPTAYQSDPVGQTAQQLRQMTVISGQFVKYDRVSRTLYVPDGTVCHYNPPNGIFYLNDNRHPILTVHDCSDPFGNTVTLQPGTNNGSPILTVSQGLGNGQSRDVVFTLNADGNPGTMTFGNSTWHYDYLDTAAGTRD
jgi:hypothetical protein